jgi:membrane-associated phospholipid phosphatase
MEKAESTKILANLLRTAPYTFYVASLSCGFVFPDSIGMNLFYALVFCELSNHLMKHVLKRALGVEYTARPKGAIDCGIYPQHNPRLSLSSGLPSGHSQTAGFLFALMMRHINERLEPEQQIVPTIFVSLFAFLIVLSRTKYGGPFISISVRGKVPGCHTIFQVAMGSIIGIVLGYLAFPFVFSSW